MEVGEGDPWNPFEGSIFSFGILVAMGNSCSFTWFSGRSGTNLGLGCKWMTPLNPVRIGFIPCQHERTCASIQHGHPTVLDHVGAVIATVPLQRKISRGEMCNAMLRFLFRAR